MTEIRFVRHGKPERGDDPGLSATGKDQARRLAEWWEHERVDVLVTSPLRRARETADLLGEGLGIQIAEVLPDLQEWRHRGGGGPYIPLDERPSNHPPTLAVLEGRYPDYLLLADVDQDEVRERAVRTLAYLLDKYSGQRIVAVGHGGFGSTLLGHVMGIPEIYWTDLPYTSVSRIGQLPSGIVVPRSIGCVDHLRDHR